MKVIWRVLFGSLWIVLVGFLKVALFAYTLCLPDTAIASGGTESNKNATAAKPDPSPLPPALSGAENQGF